MTDSGLVDALSTPTSSYAAMDMSCSQDTDGEPSTQPLDEGIAPSQDSQDAMDVQDNPAVYGFLLPLRPHGPRITIDQDVFTVGRSLKTSYKLPESNSTEYSTISKVHFIIRKENRAGAVSGIFLQDKSSNGTFVNGKKVGKERSVVLSHNDVIGVVGEKLKHFIFMVNNRDHVDRYPEALRANYIVSRELGKGACGTVFLAIRKSDHITVAVKEINKKKVSMASRAPGVSPADNVMNEVRLLRKVDHPCIIRLEDVVETPETLYIVLELADGGELFEKIIAKTKLQEAEAKLHFYQILSAIDYLHKQQIAHRDLKPENILLCSHDDTNPIVKVTDLGLSKFVDVHTHLKTFCGTPQYLAPEVLFSRVRGDGSYDLKVDCWSLGVILYILLCGCPPFNPERKDKPLIRQVTEGDYSFPQRYWSSISPSAVDLVKKLMTVEPAKRLSAGEALKHEWMRDPAIVEKAERLMDTQRRLTRMETCGGVSALNGILPDEWSAGGMLRQMEEDGGGKHKVNGSPGGKRSLPDEAEVPEGQEGCKRVRR